MGNQHIGNRVLRFLASMPVAIGLLSVLALASMVGTLVAQDQTRDYYLSHYGSNGFRLLSWFGLNHVYDSSWYIGLLVFLVLSVTAALFRHGPRIWRQTRALQKVPNWPGNPDSLREIACDYDKSVLTRAEVELRKMGFREFYRDHGGDGSASVLFARRGRFGKLGFFPLHAAIVVIAAGTLVTAVFGFRGFMNIPDGASQNTVYVGDGDGYRSIQLPFTVHNEGFAVDYYKDGMPSSYRTHLRLVNNTTDLANKKITVNDPLHYRGITFYQASYGDAGSLVTIVLRDLSKPDLPGQIVKTAVGRLLGDNKGTQVTISELHQHNVINMSTDPARTLLKDVGPSLDVQVRSPSEGTITYRLYRYHPSMLAFARMDDADMTYDDLGFSPGDNRFTRLLSAYLRQLKSVPGTLGPAEKHKAFDAALRELKLATDDYSLLRLQTRIEHTASLLARYRLPLLFSFVAYTPKLYSGLQVARDPGAPWVLSGALMLMLGLLQVIYLRERLIGVRVCTTDVSPVIQICALARHDKRGAQRLVARLEARLRPPCLLSRTLALGTLQV